MNAAPRTWTLWTLLAAVAAVTLLLYARTAAYGFINYDDYDYVVRNPHVQDGLSLASLRWALTTGYFSYWHPLTWLGYLALVSLFGVTPGPMHVANFCLHAANAALLLYVLWRMTGRVWPAAVAAALFAWHPLRVESVAWVSELKDVLGAFFWLLTMLAYVRYVERPGGGRYALVALCYLLGLASKPMLVTLPGALLLLDYWPLGRTPWLRRDGVPPATRRRLLLEKVPLLAMAMVAAGFVIKVQSANQALSQGLPLTLRLQNALVSVSKYLGRLFWPTDMAIFYPHPGHVLNGRIGAGPTIVAALLFVAITAAALLTARRKPYLIVGWLWMLGVLLPVSGVVQAGDQAMADRYSYIPLMFATVAVVWLVADWVASKPARGPLVTAVTSVALLALLIKTTIQIGYWRDDASLFAHALRVTRNNYLAHSSRGYTFYQQGRPDQAIAHYRRALEIFPTRPRTHGNMGKALQSLGRFKEAEHHYRVAIGFAAPDPDLHNNLANILAEQRRFREAIEQHEAAVRLEPGVAHAWFNFGVTLAAAGRFADAQAKLEQALRLDPEHADARYAYAAVMEQRGHLEAAEAQYIGAIQLRPSRIDAHRRLAWLLAAAPEARVRSGARAVIVAERLNQLTGFGDAAALDALAAAYAEAGRFDAAAATATRALALATSRDQSDLAAQIERRLALYQSGQAFRAPASKPASAPASSPSARPATTAAAGGENASGALPIPARNPHNR